MSVFSKRLKECRENLKDSDSKWTQKYVANKIGVARVTYTAYENATKMPPFDTINSIASLFDVKTDYLMGRTNEPTPTKEDDKASLIEEMAKKYPDADIMFDNLAEMTVEQLKEVDDFIKFKLQKKGD